MFQPIMIFLFFISCQALFREINPDEKLFRTSIREFSSLRIKPANIEGLPHQITVTGDDPPYINDTYLLEKMGGSIDYNFMAITRPPAINNSRGSCKLKHRWYKQPLKIWPRWIQVRTCFDKDYDMPGNVNKCFPSGQEAKELLHYVCQEIVDGIKSCGWMKFGYPFITECRPIANYED